MYLYLLEMRKSAAPKSLIRTTTKLQQFKSIYKANFVINRLVTVDTFAEGEVVNLNDVVWNTQTKKSKNFYY